MSLKTAPTVEKAAREREGDVQVEPEGQPPPAYSANPLDLTAAFSNLDLSLSRVEPTPNFCIAHLKLLEVFHQLREDVATSDGLFGLADSLSLTGTDEQSRAEVLLSIREKRWAVYVARAVSRFKIWWQKSIQPRGEGMLKLSEIQATIPDQIYADNDGTVLPFTSDNLPPIGRHYRTAKSVTAWLSFFFRCNYGLAFVHAESKVFSRRLPTVWETEVLAHRIAVGRDRCLHQQWVPRIHCKSRGPAEL